MKQIKTSTGLIIIFAATVLFFGGALSYYTYAMPTSWDLQTHDSPVVKKTTTKDATADWKTYENKDYGFSFKYPKDWEYRVSNDTANVDGRKYKTFVSFRPSTLKEDFLGSIAVEQDTLANSVVTIKKTFASNSTFVGKSNVQISKYNATKLSFRNNSDKSILPIQYLLEKNNLIYILSGEGSTGSIENEKLIKGIINSFLLISIDTATTTATPVTTPTTTPSTSLTYNNDTYGFSLTLPASWDGYKVKSANIEGSVATFYFGLPTTDPLYKDGSSTADAGYASPFVISIINKADWTGSHEQTIDFGSKIGENDTYVFTSSNWQAMPTDMTDAITAQAKTIVDSFKLN